MATIQRLLWRCGYPLALACHKMFGTSYLWVNVGHGAWRRRSFDALWQHKWYGDPIHTMPDKVNLCGIRFTVSVADGLIQFVNRDMSEQRLCFERDPHDKHAMCWYFYSAGRHVAAERIERAYQWIKAVYGGSHEFKRPAVTATPGN